MGTSCCCDIDVEEIYNESKSVFSPNNLEYTNFDKEYYRLLKCSIEEIDKKMAECEKKISKISRMSSCNKLKSFKINIALSYLKLKLNQIEMVKKTLLYKKYQEERFEIFNREIDMICNYLCQLFPKNYFLPKEEEEDDFISSNWGNLPINILGKYDDGSDLWLENNNEEWEKAFHGTGRHCKTDEEIKEMIDSIIKNGFKNGDKNAHANCNDIFHPGKKIGNGVYVSPNIDIAKQYAGTIINQGSKYLTLFLVKVKRSAIRKCNCPDASDYWILRGTNQEIRPVSVLLSEF